MDLSCLKYWKSRFCQMERIRILLKIKMFLLMGEVALDWQRFWNHKSLVDEEKTYGIHAVTLVHACGHRLVQRPRLTSTS